MPKTGTILLAEDDENDVFLFRRALQKANLEPELFHVADGQEALDYLTGRAPYSDRDQFPMPDLVLLDLKMPRLGGLELLEHLRGCEELRRVPIVVFSSSDHERDQQEARRLGAAAYHRKPGNPADLVRLVQQLHMRWLQASKAG